MINIDRKYFLRLLGLLKAGVPEIGRQLHTLPILSCVRFQVKPGGVFTMEATDLDHFLEIDVMPIQGLEEVDSLIPFRSLEEALKGMSSVSVSLEFKSSQVGGEHEKHELVIKDSKGAGSFRTVESGFPVDQFPGPSRMEDLSLSYKMDASGLHRILDRVILGASKDPVYETMCGVYLDPQKGFEKVRAVATNGHYLLLDETGIWEAEVFSEGERWKTISGVGARGLIRLCKSNKDGTIKVSVSRSPSKFEFQGDGWSYQIRGSEGDFPRYPGVLPSLKSYKALDAVYFTEQFYGAAKSAKIFSKHLRDRVYMVNVGFLESTDMVLSSPEGAETKGEEIVPSDDGTIGPGVAEKDRAYAGFNVDYLKEVAQFFNKGGIQKIRVRVKDPLSGVHFEPVSEEKDGSLAYLMPCRI